MNERKIRILEKKIREYFDYVVNLPEDSKDYQAKRHQSIVTKEAFARKFKAKTHEVDHIFRKLNLEGLLSQPKHSRYDSEWYPDIYYVKKPYQGFFDSIIQGDKEKVKRYLEKGFCINTEYGNQRALSVAIDAFQTKEFIQFLLKKGANPTQDDQPTILFLAIRNKYEKETLKMLIEASKNPFVEDENGNNLLHFCSTNENYCALLQSILEFGFPIDKKNNEGKTPLMLAIEHQSIETVKTLLEKGASIKAKDVQKKTSFTIAYEKGNDQILKMFLPFHQQLTKQEKKLFKKVRLKLLF